MSIEISTTGTLLSNRTTAPVHGRRGDSGATRAANGWDSLCSADREWREASGEPGREATSPE